MSEVQRISVFVHGPNKKIDVVEAVHLDHVTAERDALQVRVNELREDFQELSEQSERRGSQASEFEERMGDLQVENGKLQDRITLLSDSGEHVESHLEKQVDILRIRCDALQVLLTAADERADVLEGLLREVQKSARKQDWASGYPTLFASVDAALKPAEGGDD